MIGVGIDDRETKALMRRLVALGPRVELKVVGQASRKAMKPMLKDARKRAPRRTGFFARNIVIKQKKYKRSGVTLTMIGARSKKDPVTGENPANISHLIEMGTKAHAIPAPPGGLIIGDVVIRGTVQHPGARPKPFLRPAFDAHARGVVRMMQTALSKGTEKEAAKLARQK